MNTAPKPQVAKIGDILEASWGHDQTNIDYYQVVALVGKASIKVRMINADKTYTQSMAGQCTPIPDSFRKPDVPMSELPTVRVDTKYCEDGMYRANVDYGQKAHLLRKRADGTYKSSYWSSYA